MSCVSPPLVSIIISSQPCVLSWLVPSPVSVIISFPSLYRSSVLPVSLSSLNVITCVFMSPWSPCFQLKCVYRSSSSPRSCVPGSPCVTPVWYTGIKTSECGKLLASSRTGSIGGVDKNVLHRVPKQLSGESLYNRVVSPRVGALKAIINEQC